MPGPLPDLTHGIVVDSYQFDFGSETAVLRVQVKELQLDDDNFSNVVDDK